MENPSRPNVAFVVPDSSRFLEEQLLRRYAGFLHITVLRIPPGLEPVASEPETFTERLTPVLEQASTTSPDLVVLATTAPGRIGGLAFDHEVARRVVNATGAEVVTATDAVMMGLDVIRPTQVAVFTPSSGPRAKQTANLVTEIGYHAAWVRSLGHEEESKEPTLIAAAVAAAMDGVNADCVLLDSTEWRAGEATSRLSATLRLPVLSEAECLMDLLDAWVELYEN